MTNQCKSCGYVNGGHVIGCKNEPNGVPKDVHQYQDDIKAGVDVGGELKEEAHETMHGWCCACDYDQIELNRRLEVQKAEMLSTIKGLGCNPENDSLTIARILNELR